MEPNAASGPTAGFKAVVGLRVRRFWRHLRRDPEPIVILLVAAVVAVLGATDVVGSVKTLLAVTLAVLATIGFALFKQSARQDTTSDDVTALGKQLHQVATGLDAVGQRLAPLSSVDELPAGAAIRKAFEEAVSGATSWSFRGGTGSFTRAWTLPHLAARAHGNAGVASNVRLQILNPNDEALCGRYAQYRAKLAGHRSDESNVRWTLERVRHECLATVVAAQWYRQHEFLAVEVSLRRDFSILRYDISPAFALITNEDRNFPALRVRSPGGLYSAFRAEFDRDFDELEKCPAVTKVPIPRERTEITEEEVSAVLVASGMDRAVVAGADLRAVLELAFDARDPYAPAGK